MIAELEHENSVMIALQIPDPIREVVKEKYGFVEDAGNLHITLIFIGDSRTISIDKVKGAIEMFCQIQSPIKGSLQGVARFIGDEDKDPFVFTFDSRQMPEVYERLCDILESFGIPFHRDHGFIPHMTLAYIPKDAAMPVSTIEPIEINFDAVHLVKDNNWERYNLNGNINQFVYNNSKSLGKMTYAIAAEFRGKYGRPGKVGGSSKVPGNAKDFIDAVEDSKGVFRNPLDPRSIVFVSQSGDIMANVQLQEAWEVDGKASVSFNIYVQPESREKGYATSTIKRLLKIADEQNVILQGTPSPFGNKKAMNEKQLFKWYLSLGFVKGDKPGMYGSVYYYPKIK